ncbi:DUF3530 family protein [Hahella aquimaris]|uniref:DUF3530 family protein n=1 Tax=Hahella sp. HNIBRBA332 TaxID=3015983 RepID=UPI00273CB417|nr:DUF3530 family protein [Hahella sp. HNIBRBA332]WLQ13892.1 DUF3530 family protein [Hahella sp. HNIBRBA332]
MARIITGIVVGCLLLGAVPAQAEEEPAEESSSKAASEPAPQRKPALNPQVSMLLSLAKSLPGSQVLWLNGKQGDASAMLALYKPANVAEQQGAVMLLHDRGQHPDWPQFIHSLRNELPDEGWHTLSIALTPPAEAKTPKRVLLSASDKEFPLAPTKPAAGDAPENTGSRQLETLTPEQLAETNEATEQLEQQQAAEGVDIDVSGEGDTTAETAEEPAEATVGNTERIELGMQQLSAFGQENKVLLGVGSGVDAMLRYVLANPQSMASGLSMIWINAEVGEGLLEEIKEKAPGFFSLQVLDLYDSALNLQSRNAMQRRDFARRNSMQGYRVEGMSGLSLIPSSEDGQVTRKVESWLTFHAPGMKKQAKRL